MPCSRSSSGRAISSICRKRIPPPYRVLSGVASWEWLEVGNCPWGVYWRLLTHFSQPRKCECTDGHHHVANGNVEVTCHGEIDRDQNQPGARDVRAQPRRGDQHSDTHRELDDADDIHES